LTLTHFVIEKLSFFLHTDNASVCVVVAFEAIL